MAKKPMTKKNEDKKNEDKKKPRNSGCFVKKITYEKSAKKCKKVQKMQKIQKNANLQKENEW